MPSLWSEVQLTYAFIMTVFQGIFRAIGIGLHSRDLHTAQSAHSAVGGNRVSGITLRKALHDHIILKCLSSSTTLSALRGSQATKSTKHSAKIQGQKTK